MGNPSRVRMTGPLTPYLKGFRGALVAQGYRANSVCYQLNLMAHVSRWLVEQGLTPAELTAERVEQFLVARREAGYVLWCSTKGVAPLLTHLRSLGVTPEATVPPATTANDKFLETYRAYLTEERGLSPDTIAGYLHVARLFLATRPGAPLELDLAGITARDVTGFLLRDCTERSVGSAKYVACGLRAVLRYLFVSGALDRSLAAAVPPVAGWRLSSLPRGLEAAAVRGLLDSCDRRTTFGRRDFAVLTLLVRLGLRAGEVAALRLDDIDWRVGEMLIRGKGPKQEYLPLPVDAGEAVVAWLRRGRPRCSSREVFTRVRAPHQGLSSAGVSAIVGAACRRAGLPEVNAHVLRHTAATEMLRAGAGLIEIGQLLRHESVLTTAIYAKVDRSSLSALARPWPGGEE